MLEQGLIAGRYRLLQFIRRGGMSEVYRARDEQTGRDVAIKLVSIEKEECAKRLQREIKMMSRLRHPHILPILDFGSYEDYYFLVTPYMKRGNLRERLSRGALTLEEVGSILEQVASALHFAHKHGILHRDIKPSNILLDDDTNVHIYLCDFGLAKLLGEGSDITQTGCLVGTPEYMAPELAYKPESVSSEVYALGVLLYQMLTGRLPFTGGTPLSIYWKHIREYAVPPSIHNPVIPPVVEAVVLRALEKDPAKRFRNVELMAQAYTGALRSMEAGQEEDVSRQITLPPAQVTLHKTTRPLVETQSRSWMYQAGHVARMGLVGVAAAALFAAPLTLGFALAHHELPNNPIFASAPFFGSPVQVSNQPHTPTPSPTATPTPPAKSAKNRPYIKVNKPPVKVDEEPSPSSQGRHGHGHGHKGKHGGDD
ncbi:MAG TPA: serine/threonine-protein kinase [Ktedonobacteraceae bacterium]|jgi:serine/threonine protein kinase|nr:serine/threonine-protein kinase [Ktedonobacteraceae bacterium]